MNYALQFFRNPLQFYERILDSKVKRFVIIVLLSYSVLFIISHLGIEQLGEVQSALFYVDNRFLSVLLSLLLEFLTYGFLATLIYLLSHLIKIACQFKTVLLSVFSLKIISAVELLLKLIFYWASFDLIFIETLGWIEFLVELIYLFIAIRVIFATSTIKAIFVQIISLFIIALISLYLFSPEHDSEKAYQFKTINEVGLGDDKKVIIEGIIKWKIQDPVYFEKNIGNLEISEERIDDYYYAYMYEAIVIEYANKEVPKVIDRVIIDKITKECNKKLDDEESGIKIVDLQLKGRTSVSKKIGDVVD